MMALLPTPGSPDQERVALAAALEHREQTAAPRRRARSPGSAAESRASSTRSRTLSSALEATGDAPMVATCRGPPCALRSDPGATPKAPMTSPAGRRISWLSAFKRCSSLTWFERSRCASRSRALEEVEHRLREERRLVRARQRAQPALDGGRELERVDPRATEHLAHGGVALEGAAQKWIGCTSECLRSSAAACAAATSAFASAA